jgi:hypothetical protein
MDACVVMPLLRTGIYDVFVCFSMLPVMPLIKPEHCHCPNDLLGQIFLSACDAPN